MYVTTELQPDKPGMATKFLALLCRVCPFCLIARRFPRSAYARALARVERACPACKAYAEVKREH